MALLCALKEDAMNTFLNSACIFWNRTHFNVMMLCVFFSSSLRLHLRQIVSPKHNGMFKLFMLNTHEAGFFV